MRKQYRQIITYHPTLGHTYVPSVYNRVRYGHNGYFIKTDAHGFRNSHTDFSREGILVIGDSYAAGDGISNENRFSDQLQKMTGIPVYNISVSGYGIDQQLLAYCAFKDKYPHHTVIFCPHQDDLIRNTLTEREGIEHSTGNKILIPKPYFKLENGVLKLSTYPVPLERNQIIKNSDGNKGENSVIGKAKNKIIGLFKSEKTEVNSDILDLNSGMWQLTDALIKLLINEVNGKNLIIAPFTYSFVTTEKQKDHFTGLFDKYKSKQTEIFNATSIIQKNYDSNNETFLEICSHFTPKTHTKIAIELATLPFIASHKKPTESNQEQKQKSQYVLGISCFYHDAAAALLENGKIIAAAQEERFTRKKHDKNFPENAIHYCLEQAGINADELDTVAYYDKESLTIERVLHNAFQKDVATDPYWKNAGASLITKLKLPLYLQDRFNYNGSILKYDHHLTHAASTYYASAFNDAAILILDGVGEWACSTIASGKGNEIKILKQQFYPHSIGLLYSAFTYFCGFKVNSGEYKLMGLAPYGVPKYTSVIREKLTKVNEDGSLLLNMEYFSFLQGEKMTNDKFAELFGGPERKGESRITRREMDLAASIQQFTEEIVVKMANYAKKITGSDYLVMAGGVALNCVANGKLYEQTDFKDFFFQPASGDAGGALGAAYLAHFENNPEAQKTNSKQSHSYLGPEFSSTEIESFLNSKGLKFHPFDNARAKKIAELLNENYVVGYFDGRMEFGPRALGARSIIGNALNPEMQSKLNLKIKFRESFRPFAPIYAEEKTSQYFEFDKPSPYMLVVRPVKKDLCYAVKPSENEEDLIEWVNQIRSKLPSITHVDYSARLQSVNKTENPRFHDVLKEFGKLTGWEILINTSFNVRGEPIVCTPEDAYRCFMRTHMDILVLGDFFLVKSEQPNWQEIEKWEELYELD